MHQPGLEQELRERPVDGLCVIGCRTVVVQGKGAGRQIHLPQILGALLERTLKTRIDFAEFPFVFFELGNIHRRHQHDRRVCCTQYARHGCATISRIFHLQRPDGCSRPHCFPAVLFATPAPVRRCHPDVQSGTVDKAAQTLPASSQAFCKSWDSHRGSAQGLPSPEVPRHNG